MKINIREPRTQKTLLAMLAIAGAGYYYFMNDSLSFSYRSRARAVAEKRDARDTLANEVKKARASVSRLEALKRENEELQARWTAVEARLPSEIDARELMNEITTLGTHEGLQFLLLEPHGTRSLGFCEEVPFSVRVLGHYHQMGRFFAALDNAPRILKLSGLRLVQNPKGKEDKQEAPLIAELEVSTFTLGSGMPPGMMMPPPEPGEGRQAIGASATVAPQQDGPVPAVQTPAGRKPVKAAKKAARASSHSPKPPSDAHREPVVGEGGAS